MLDAWHPGLIEKMDAMFAEFWPAAEIRQMVQAHYGERLSLSAIEKYRSKQWRAKRDLVQQASAALAASQALAVEACLGLRRQQLPPCGFASCRDGARVGGREAVAAATALPCAPRTLGEC